MSELIKSISIAALLAEYERVKAGIERIHAEYFELHDSVRFCDVNHVAYGSDRYRHNGFLFDGVSSKSSREKSLEQALNRLRAQMWSKLMNESGMKTFMGASEIDKWDEMVREERQMHLLPELNKENIEATFSALHDDKEKLFNRAVVEVFKGLSWEYKTNQPQKFGKRIILNWIRSRNTCDKINDLEKAFHVLEQKEPKDYRQAFGSLLYQANFMQYTPDTHETEYLSAKTFKKGSCHITFKRPDLVERLNKIIAIAYPNALPAAR